MGAKPWSHFTPYQADINVALQSLKEQEFRAGRYGFGHWFRDMTAVMEHLGMPDAVSLDGAFVAGLDEAKPSADKLIERYGSVEAAMKAVLESSSDSGTASVLDMIYISQEPATCAVCPLSGEELQEIFQTSQPSREIIQAILLNEEEIEDFEGAWELFWENIGRGEGRYIIAYDDGQPTELFFAGYSVD
jgi:hypothetical protein